MIPAMGKNRADSYTPIHETGLYYLQSRYYNPTWDRFINADALVSTGQGTDFSQRISANSVCFRPYLPRSAHRILKPQEECASREKSNLKKCCKNAKNVLTKRKTLDIIHKLSDSTTEYGGIAQLGERLNGIQEVSGSIPLISTKKLRNLRISELFSLFYTQKSSEFRPSVSRGETF